MSSVTSVTVNPAFSHSLARLPSYNTQLVSVSQRRRALKKSGAGSCNFLTDCCKFPTAKLLKIIKDLQYLFYYFLHV